MKSTIFVLALLPIVTYSYLRFTTDYAMTAYISFSSRTLSGIVLPGLIILAIIIVYGKRTLNPIGVGTFVVAFLVMTVFNLSDLRHWVSVKNEFQATISSEVKYVSIDNTSLKDNHYRWSWNNPLLSLVWAGACVNTIILNSPDGPQGPFNPQERLVLKHYLQYDEYFKTVDQDIVVCDI